MTIENAIKIAMINGKGEARRQCGMSYEKVVPVPRTISDAVDLHLNHKSYGLTAEEIYKVSEILKNK